MLLDSYDSLATGRALWTLKHRASMGVEDGHEMREEGRKEGGMNAVPKLFVSICEET